MNRSKLCFLSAMGIFGTLGIFVRYIPLPSSVISLFRAVLGLVFLAGVMLLGRKKPDRHAIRKNLLLLILSGIAMGFNWVALFESYKYTTIATATVCYYLAPLLLLLVCPLLGETLTLKKLVCIGVALIGLVLVSDVLDGEMPPPSAIKGLLLGVGAAVLYATVMFLNKKLSPISAYDKTVMQLGSAAVIMLPYILLSQEAPLPTLTVLQWVLILVVGILHTGIAYALYFSSLKELNTQTIAVFSYLDPAIAVLLSALVLGEPMRFGNIIGTVLILGSALYSELPEKRK